ncbi:MAG TPA: NUDIX domain-containing protein [Pseudonocardiaceae bacterium]
MAITTGERVLIVRGRGISLWTFPFDLVTAEETVEETVYRLVRDHVDADDAVISFMTAFERGSTVESDDHGVTLVFKASMPTTVQNSNGTDHARWVTWDELHTLPLYPPELHQLRRNGMRPWYPLNH